MLFLSLQPCRRGDDSLLSTGDNDIPAAAGQSLNFILSNGA